MKKISIALILCIVLSTFAITASAIEDQAIIEEPVWSKATDVNGSTVYVQATDAQGNLAYTLVSVPDTTVTTTMSPEESAASAVVDAALTPDYGSMAQFQVGAINEFISGVKRFVDNICDAELPTKAAPTEKTTFAEAVAGEAVTAEAEVNVPIPQTGDSAAIALALVAVLTLGAGSFVLLRKKED